MKLKTDGTQQGMCLNSYFLFVCGSLPIDTTIWRRAGCFRQLLVFCYTLVYTVYFTLLLNVKTPTTQPQINLTQFNESLVWHENDFAHHHPPTTHLTIVPLAFLQGGNLAFLQFSTHPSVCHIQIQISSAVQISIGKYPHLSMQELWGENCWHFNP